MRGYSSILFQILKGGSRIFFHIKKGGLLILYLNAYIKCPAPLIINNEHYLTTFGEGNWVDYMQVMFPENQDLG